MILITEFGQFGFEVDGNEEIVSVYNFTREPSNHLSFNIKFKGRWRKIYYWNSAEDKHWLWASKSKEDGECHYELFPYKVTKFYYNTILEVEE